LYFSAGIAALVAAVLGVALPVLPTTPFVLLAAACFARSSERFHSAMMHHRWLGPILSDWQEHRAMKRATKHAAFFMLVVSFGASMLIVPTHWHRALLFATALVLSFFIWRVPVRPDPQPMLEPHKS
jgi:uncharacterized membrane protein YbaN (DUF454 family)